MKQQLQTLYEAGEAMAIANWVIEEYSGTTRQRRKLLAHERMAPSAVTKIKDAMQQLLQGKPLQYVLGYVHFYNMRFKVNEAVLIPRPETEELVDWIVKDYRNQQKNLQILDIGTGSGCIPVSLQRALPNTKITSVDVSAAALQVAIENAAKNSTHIKFQQLDFLDEQSWEQLQQYNVIVSNPPYIPQQEKAEMSQQVTAWEPATALFVPDNDPLLFYKKIALFGKTHLLSDGIIYLETHKDFAAAVQQLFTQQGYAAELKKDMHGNDRMVKAVNGEKRREA